MRARLPRTLTGRAGSVTAGCSWCTSRKRRCGASEACRQGSRTSAQGNFRPSLVFAGSAEGSHGPTLKNFASRRAFVAAAQPCAASSIGKFLPRQACRGCSQQIFGSPLFFFVSAHGREATKNEREAAKNQGEVTKNGGEGASPSTRDAREDGGASREERERAKNEWEGSGNGGEQGKNEKTLANYRRPGPLTADATAGTRPPPSRSRGCGRRRSGCRRRGGRRDGRGR